MRSFSLYCRLITLGHRYAITELRFKIINELSYQFLKYIMKNETFILLLLFFVGEKLEIIQIKLCSCRQTLLYDSLIILNFNLKQYSYEKAIFITALFEI